MPGFGGLPPELPAAPPQAAVAPPQAAAPEPVAAHATGAGPANSPLEVPLPMIELSNLHEDDGSVEDGFAGTPGEARKRVRRQPNQAWFATVDEREGDPKRVALALALAVALLALALLVKTTGSSSSSRASPEAREPASR